MKKYTGAFGYHVHINQRCDHEQHSSEPYGDWSASYTNSIDTKVTRVKDPEKEYPDVTTPFEVKAGENALVVWVEWSSGDSFGHGTNSCVEVIGMFKDLDSAVNLKKQISEHSDGKVASYKFTTPDGQIFESGFASWHGYFETLESVNIDTVTVW